MASKCRACGHPERPEIDRMLIAGTRQRAIGERFGISPRALRRHASAHLVQSLTKAREAHDVANGEALLTDAQALKARALAMLDAAEKAQDTKTAIAAMREVRGILELLGKLAGAIKDATVNVTTTHDNKLAVIVLRALDAYPEARAALAAHLTVEGIEVPS